jgi:hypothetical protein
MNLLDFPRLVLVGSFLLLWLAAWVGGRLHVRYAKDSDDILQDFGVIEAAALTLLGLIIGLSFSMATGRYDLRKNYEEAEANAIGTEYVRLDLLPAGEAPPLRALLRQYVELRIRFYESRDNDELKEIDRKNSELQSQLWAGVTRTAGVQPTPIRALVVAGMNDVLNSEGYTQAAWWNRIPTAAWLMMIVIALFCNVLVGYGAKRIEPRLSMVLPLIAATSFFLIADLDSPRSGVIRVHPQNLKRLQAELHAE